MYKFLVQFVFVFYAISGFSQQNTGWVTLSDGKSLNGFKKLAGNANYTTEGGAIVGITTLNSPNTFLVSEKEYGDFILEMDILLQDSTLNSGVQIRSHFDPAGNSGKGKVFGYQFELDPSSRKWFGGIYDEGRRGWLYPLSLNTSAQGAYQPGKYNKVRIECIGNLIQTFVNGVPASALIDAEDAKGFIALQVHSIEGPSQAGKKIRWKNIRIKTAGITPTPVPKDMYVVNFIPNSLTEMEKQRGWRLLFDGKTPAGWKAAYKPGFPQNGWSIQNGELTILAPAPEKTGGANGSDIVTDKQFHAFDFNFDFKVTEGANSGVKYFTTLSENKPGSALGLEYQVLDDERHPDAKEGINGNRTLSSLYDLIPAVKQKRFVNPAGQWNHARIVVYPNNHVEHYLNGVKVLEYERGSAAFRQLVAGSKFKKIENFGEAEKGYILIQDHGASVSYRSLRIREL